MPDNDPGVLDYIHAAVGESLAVIGYLQDKPVPVAVQAQPAVTVGISGQTSLLIILAVGLAAIVWATRK